MSRRKNLIALENGSDAGEPTAEEPMAEDMTAGQSQDDVFEPAEDEFEGWEEDAPEPRRNILLPTLAILAIASWTAFFGWVHHQEMLAGTTPGAWAEWIIDWSVPVLLVVALWLLAMRNSVREARRFGETAQLLSAESAALEARLTTVNRELSLARDFIASQSRDLESLGRVATERLSTHADRLQALIRDNGEQVNAIGSVSDTAVSNMDKLRDQLPVVSNAARDVANQIGNAGNTAQGQLEELVAGFERLNEFGEASTRQVDSLGAKVSEMLAGFAARLEELERQSGERFATLREKDEEFRLELEARETDTLAAIRRRAEDLQRELAELSAQASQQEELAASEIQSRLATLRDEGTRLSQDLRDSQGETEELWKASIEALRERMTQAITDISKIDEAAMDNARRRMEALQQAGERVDETMKRSTQAFDEEFARRREEAEAAEEQALAALEERISQFASRNSEAQEQHLAHMAALAERGDALGQRLAEFDRELYRLAEKGGEQSDKLAQSSELLAERLSQSRAILEENGTFVARLTDDCVRLLEFIRSSTDYSEGALSSAIGNAESRLAQFEVKAAAVAELVSSAEGKGRLLEQHVASTGEQSAAQIRVIEGLQEGLAAIASQTTQLTEQAREELQQAIESLQEASTSTLAEMRSGQAEAVRAIAEKVGSEGAEAIEEAIRKAASETIAELESASAKASERGRETASALRDQLVRVNELASNLEQRVAQARARAEEQVDNDFTRRMALITDSLNSCSIDIAKAFDAEVSDLSWASYLRGDRGIFTRRAVRLLDNSQSRSISEAYEADPELREAINRYIHDFEAMLRGVLSTRDGNAIAVTLLSSDIGKLYVALAQAIERLRD